MVCWEGDLGFWNRDFIEGIGGRGSMGIEELFYCLVLMAFKLGRRFRWEEGFEYFLYLFGEGREVVMLDRDGRWV